MKPKQIFNYQEELMLEAIYGQVIVTTKNADIRIKTPEGMHQFQDFFSENKKELELLKEIPAEARVRFQASLSRASKYAWSDFKPRPEITNTKKWKFGTEFRAGSDNAPIEFDPRGPIIFCSHCGAMMSLATGKGISEYDNDNRFVECSECENWTWPKDTNGVWAKWVAGQDEGNDGVFVGAVWRDKYDGTESRTIEGIESWGEKVASCWSGDAEKESNGPVSWDRAEFHKCGTFIPSLKDAIAATPEDLHDLIRKGYREQGFDEEKEETARTVVAEDEVEFFSEAWANEVSEHLAHLDMVVDKLYDHDCDTDKEKNLKINDLRAEIDQGKADRSILFNEIFSRLDALERQETPVKAPAKTSVDDLKDIGYTFAPSLWKQRYRT